MKNKKLLLKISIVVVSILILAIITLTLLGKKERVGYLSELKLNVNKTLEINGLDINKTKQLFTINNKLDNAAITNYIFTNASITNYSYDFRIKYYSKVFRNSDIYGVYPNLNNLPEYVQSAKMYDNNGTPFGNLVSIEKINTDKIDNVIYDLNIKNNVVSFTILIIIFLFIVYFIIIYCKNIINFIFLKQVYLFNSKSIIKLIGFILIFVFMFIFISTIHPKYIPFNVVVISDTVGQGTINDIKWETKYGFNDLQKYDFSNAMVQTIKYDNDKISIKINNSNINLSKYNYKNYYIIDDIVKDKKIEIFSDDKILFSNISDNNMSIIIDKKKQLINLSYALYDANNVNIYTKGWKISTDDFFRRYSLIMYSKYDRSIQPLLINGNGIGDIIFDNFNNIFYQDIKRGTWETYRICSLLVATMIYTILIVLILKIIVNVNFRYKIIKNNYIICFVIYFIVMLIIFYSIGNYSPISHFYIFLKNNIPSNSDRIFSYFIVPTITEFLAGYKGFIIPTILFCSFIMLILYFLLIKMNVNKYVSSIFPVLFMLIPNVNLPIFAAGWDSYLAGLCFALSCLLIFLFVYGDKKYKKYYISFSFIISIISCLYRIDYVPILFISILSIFLFIFKIKFKYNLINLMFTIIVSFIVCMLILKIVSFTYSPNKSSALYSQYLYAYLHPKFYSDNIFTDEEKIILKFYEPYNYYKYSKFVEVSNRLEGLREYYTFHDYHPIINNSSDIEPNILKNILIDKILKYPYPILYARIQAFKYYILPIDVYRFSETIRNYNEKNVKLLDVNLEKNMNIVYNDFLNKIIPVRYKLFARIVLKYFGFINILIMMFIFFNFKKAPIIAYLNISSLMCYFILFFTSIVPSYYHYGPYLLGILSIILYVYESRYVENKFDVSVLKRLIKQEKIK